MLPLHKPFQHDKRNKNCEATGKFTFQGFQHFVPVHLDCRGQAERMEINGEPLHCGLTCRRQRVLLMKQRRKATNFSSLGSSLLVYLPRDFVARRERESGVLTILSLSPLYVLVLSLCPQLRTKKEPLCRCSAMFVLFTKWHFSVFTSRMGIDKQKRIRRHQALSPSLVLALSTNFIPLIDKVT